MGFSGWHLLAQTESKQNMGSAWQAKIYEYTTDNVTSSTVSLMTGFNIRRGNASAKDKTPRITPTEISFAIKDESGYLFNRMADKSDELFRCVITKDSGDFFIGFLLLMTPRREFNVTKSVIKLKAYEGFGRLKDHYNYSGFPDGLQPKTEILRTILNTFDFDLDIKIYQDVNQAAANITREQLRIQDYLAVAPGASYYDVLIMILQQSNYELYQYEGYWICRQIMTFKVASLPWVLGGMHQYLIDYSDGSQTLSYVGKNVELTLADLSTAPQAFRAKSYTKVKVKQRCFNPQTLPKRHNNLTDVSWVNGYFKQGNAGWTTSAGSPEFCDGCVKMAPGDIIYQDSGVINANEELIIEVHSVGLRMVLVNEIFPGQDDRVDELIVQIQYRATGGTIYYYDKFNNRWTIGNIYLSMFMGGITQNGEYITEYTLNTLKESIEIPAPPEEGVIRILLRGGTAPVYNYPLEFVQHNYATVKYKQTNEHDIDVPANLICSAEVTSSIDRVLELDVPFADLDPFNVNIWYYNGPEDPYYERCYLWTDGTYDYGLIEFIARRTLALHQDSQGVDIKLLPGTICGYDNLVYGNVDGNGIRHYIPVYEEGELINDIRRFVLLEHEHASISPTVRKYYEYNTSGGGSAGSAESVTLTPYAASYYGNTKLSLNNQYVKIVPVSFDVSFTSGIIYYKNLLDQRLLKIEIVLTAGHTAAATMVIKHNATTVFEAARANLQRTATFEKSFYRQLTDGDYIYAEYTLNGAVDGAGYILLYFEAKG
jgi:hypothetical protein